MTKRAIVMTLVLGSAALACGCSLNNLIEPRCEPCTQSSELPSNCLTAIRFDEPRIQDQWLAPTPSDVSPLALDESSITEETTLALTLDQCIQIALENSPVLRDLGGTVIRNPQAQGTRFDPALAVTDPRFGQQRALAEFDANLAAGLTFENVDRRFNSFLLGNNGFLEQDLHTYQWNITKTAATGGRYAFRHVTLYDANNQPSNTLGPSTFDTYVEGEVRHPLMQGAGTKFNRIAGPNATPGNINGVLIARVRQDISLADFERSVRDLVADVENAYWDLYFAYRDLNAKIDVRDKARETYEGEISRREASAGGIESGDVEQAEEQFYRFQADVLDALNGRPLDATRTYNGSFGGTFRGSGGLRIAERRLRLILGATINDGRIIRPLDTPPSAAVVHDWDSALTEATILRPELRRQRWLIKQHELELTANRNFLKPRLDLVGRYRLRGFGKELLGDDMVVNNGTIPSAGESLLEGEFQEWQAGVELQLPIGFRQAHAAIRNSQLQLERERAILEEQERNVTYGLSNAFSEVSRAYDNRLLQEKRLLATSKQINKLDARRESGSGGAPLDVILEAYRRYLDIRLRYHQAEVEYVLALRNVQFEKGTLLEYCNVALTESQWSGQAYQDAAEREKLRLPATQPQHRDPVISRAGTAIIR
jgi:outer membrane protein TolC